MIPAIRAGKAGVTKLVTLPKPVTKNATLPVTNPVTVTEKVTQPEKVTLEAGKPCPTCGRQVPLSSAEKQRRYRERQK